MQVVTYYLCIPLTAKFIDKMTRGWSLLIREARESGNQVRILCPEVIWENYFQEFLDNSSALLHRWDSCLYTGRRTANERFATKFNRYIRMKEGVKNVSEDMVLSNSKVFYCIEYTYIKKGILYDWKALLYFRCSICNMHQLHEKFLTANQQ